MTGYSAKFSNGKTAEIKSSKREYGAAYCTVVKCGDGQERTWTGFSRTKELAERSSMMEPRDALKGIR